MYTPITDFNELKVAELDDVARTFAVDFETGANKNAKISQLLEEGVTVSRWNELMADEPDAPEQEVHATILPVNPPPMPVKKDKVLVKMTSRHPSLRIRGYEFAYDHPFVLVTEEDADYLCSDECEYGTFSMATPKQAKEFYS